MTTETSSRRGIGGRMSDFFYSEETPYGAALVRICLPLVLLTEVLPRWPHARELFSSQGAPTPFWALYGIENGLPIPSAAAAAAMITLLVLLLITASLGWHSRLSLASSALIYAYLSLLDSTSTLDKCVCICTHALLLLSLSQCGAVWSIDAWLKRTRESGADPTPPRFPVWPQRLLQLLIGVVYLGSAVTKLNTPVFLSGEHMLYWMLSDVTQDARLGELASMYPAFIPVAAYAAVIWEITFIFLCWRGFGRGLMLAFGTVFHAMTWGLLGLTTFPLVYLCLYLAWATERDVAGAAARLSRVSVRLAPVTARVSAALSPIRGAAFRIGLVHSATAFAMLLAATALAGIELERRNDPFGERADTRYALRPIPAERVAELFSQQLTVRPEDKVFSFDLGSTMISGIVADRRRTFSVGEEAVVQCSLAPPHEDLWVEFNLTDADGRVVSRHGQIVPREQLRTTHVAPLGDDLAPGDYAWVLRLDGRDVARREFTLGTIRTASAEGRIDRIR